MAIRGVQQGSEPAGSNSGRIRTAAKARRKDHRSELRFGVSRCLWHRHALSAYTWLRTNRGPFNYWLHFVRKADSPACPNCDHQAEDGFHITFDCPKHHQQCQELIGDARTGMSMKGSALGWWKPNSTKWQTWEEAKEALLAHYSDHYKADNAHRDIYELKQTGNVQDYLANVDRLNAYAEIPPSQLIRLILLGIKPRLRSKMTHYEDLRDQPTAWRKKLVQMDRTAMDVQAGEDEDIEYDVEVIVDSVRRKGKVLYRIRWQGYTPEDDTWEKLEDMSCADKLQAFHERLPKKPKDSRLQRQ
ncbi:hypothetical protein EV426DRAFT_704869 [Tirmania nivea]|nr:hypothetical protein EV426DRAFT_704869 [Tirmania nivea]